MSYTPPTYVDTKSQAILALASVIADEDKTALGDGSVNRALDVLADVLAETDVQVPQTNAGAILALAQYADGMVKPTGAIAITENGTGIDVAQYATADVSVSGGGADVGNLVPIGANSATPVVNTSIGLADVVNATSIDGMFISDTQIFDGIDSIYEVTQVASGVRLSGLKTQDFSAVSIYDVSATDQYTYATVEDITSTTTMTNDGGGLFSIVVPDVDAGHAVVVVGIGEK